MQGRRRLAVAAGLLWLAGAPALAAVEITAAWSRAAPPVSNNGAAYAVFVNRGTSPEQLLGASTPVARRAELHTHVVQGDVVTMRRVPALDLPPGQQVRLQPGGLHVMLIGLKQPLSEGSTFALTFSFANAAPLTVDVPVLGADAASARTGDGHAAHGPADHIGHGDHGGHAKHESHGGNPTNALDLPAAQAPGLELSVRTEAPGVYVLQLATRNFRFAPEHADGAHVVGEGHAHLYVDGVKVKRLYAARERLVLSVAGEHVVEVGLYTNDRRAYAAAGELVRRRVAVQVPARE